MALSFALLGPGQLHQGGAMARDVHALVKNLKYDRIRIVGYDIGLMVANEAPAEVIPKLVEFLNH